MFKKYILIFMIVFTNCIYADNKSAYPLPNDNIHSQYLYISKNYENLLVKTKSHPLSVKQLKEPFSPILFYQKKYDEYSACSNLHEGSPIVKIDKTKEQVEIFDDIYYRIKIDQTVENTLSKIIIQNTFSKKHYESDLYKIVINEKIVINNVEASIAIDIVGGNNDMNQTMIRTKQKINGYNLFAIIEENGYIKLTPLKSGDIIAHNSGKTYIVK